MSSVELVRVTDILVWCLFGSGAVVYHLSLYSLSTENPLPFLALLGGILLQALSATLFVGQLIRAGPELNGRQRNLQIVYVLAFSMSMAFTRLSRYAGFNGFDFVQEGTVLQNTLANGYWDPTLGHLSNYQSSLAITMLPTMTSGIIHVPGTLTFLVQTFLLIAVLPVVVHPIVNSMTGSFRLATLSSLLLAQNWFYFGQHLIGKTAAALFLCVLAFYCLTHKKNSVRALGIFLSLGTAMSHYTISLFLVFILLSYFALSRIVVPILTHAPFFKKSPLIAFNIIPVTASVILIVLWLSFAAPMVLPTATTSAEQALGSINQLTSGPKGASASLALSTSAGPLVTVWFDFQNALIGLGGLLMLNRYRRGLLSKSLATWTLVGLALVALLAAWIVLPYLSVRVESTRILNMILPFTTVFTAVLLVRILRRPSRIATIAVLCLTLLMLPMNLQLSNQANNVLMHPENSLPQDRQFDADTGTIPTYSNYAMAIWADSNIPSNKAVEVDALGRYAFTTVLPFPPELNFSQEELPPFTFHRYTILSSYFVNHGIWSSTILGASVEIPGEDPSFFFSPAHNVLYSSPKFWIVSPAP
jgi:uncharacterized membrane protein